MTDETVDFETAVKRMVFRLEKDENYTVYDASLALVIVFDGTGAMIKEAIIERMKGKE